MNLRGTKTKWVFAALAAACGLLVVSSASASTESSARAEIKPPSGIPDLSKMALSASDLAPGAKIRRQGYIRPEQGFVASYVRVFRTGTARLGKKRFGLLGSDVELLGNVADAKLFVNLVKLFASRSDPDDLAADFRSGTGLKPRYVRVSRPTALRTGEQSFTMTTRYGTRLGEIRVVIAVLRVDRVVTYLAMVGVPKARIGPTEAKVLARPVSRRMADGLLPVNRVLPEISGTAAVGQTLTATTGSWINQPSRYSYEWRRCDGAGGFCSSIPGATSSTYALTSADTGHAILVAVTARNGRGIRTAISFATSAVAGPPVNTTPPTISGTPTVGQTLTVNPGMWAGAVTGFTYAWRRCDAGTANCVDILGATNQTYVLAAADEGQTIRVAVTATNPSGSTTAISAPTLVIDP